VSTAPTAGWTVYGSRTSYVGEVAEIIGRAGQRIDVLVDNLPDGPEPSRWGGVIAPDSLTEDASDRAVVIPFSTPGTRARVVAEARARGLQWFPPLVDPTSVVAGSAEVGEGVVVNAGAIVGAVTRLGAFVHLNRGALVAHDDVIEEFATLGPGCVLAAFVSVGRGAFLGTGCVCAPDVTIGSNSVVGAGATVIKDVPPNTVVVGNPARVVRSGIAGYHDVGV
jgi:sugar O-acyltransferase (sialic acid O-acetyltransferase NeuD family)